VLQRRQLGGAVGGPVAAALQDMLSDLDVVTLVREAVTVRVREMLVGAVGGTQQAQAQQAQPPSQAPSQPQSADCSAAASEVH
jgi:hypothetical protein